MIKQTILGESNLLTQALEHLSLIAPLHKPVLISGERGTGKELFAERLHYLSPRWEKPFLKINCAAISDSLLDSVLFGHEAGAYTGATRANKGFFERADEGTLFLDELGTISTTVQEKLLRVIEYGEFERLGGQKTISTDVRIVAASNSDLIKLTQIGKFRADLLDRLAFDVINLPPLRYRKEDILILAEHFAMAITRELNRDAFLGFNENAIQLLLNYPWPGNIRELKNVIQRSVYRQQNSEDAISQIIFNPFETIWDQQNDIEQNTKHQTNDQSHLINNKTSTEFASLTEQTINFKKEIHNKEFTLIKHYLTENHYHQKNTAKALGLTYHQLRAYLKKHPKLLS